MVQTKRTKVLLGSFVKAYWLHAFSKLLIGLAIATAVIYPMFDQESASGDHVAIIDISGTIGDSGDTENGQAIAGNILKAIRDKSTKAIILEANSGGGAPADSQIVYDLLADYDASAPVNPDLLKGIKSAIGNSNLKFMSEDIAEQYRKNALETSELTIASANEPTYRLPVIGVVRSICASACLHALIRADIIVVESTSLFGSIGVRMDVTNWHELAQKVGVTSTTLTSAKNKDALNPWKTINEEQLASTKQNLLMPVFELFKASVVEARPNLKIDVFDGSVWTGDKAIAIGLADLEATPLQVKEALRVKYGWSLRSYSKSALSLSSLFKQASDLALFNTDIKFR